MADLRAAAYQKRVAGLFAQSACSLTVTRSGADHVVPCFFAPLDNQTIGTYFDGNEAVGLLHPGLMVWAQITADIQVNDLFYHDAGNRPGGDLFTVRKVQFFRQGDTPLLLLAVCD